MKSRRWLAPEVVQTSSMDCGPASLQCLLQGFGVTVHNEWLRDACQADVDGTSIDTLEDVLGQLGVEVEQILCPPDHLFTPGHEQLPALVILRQPGGAVHFVVAWRRVGPFVQLMDPGVGRRWLGISQLSRELYVHTAVLPVTRYREWVSSHTFQAAFRERLRRIGGSALGGTLSARALSQPGHLAFAALDASVRQVDELCRAGAVRSGRRAAALVEALSTRARHSPQSVPLRHWQASPSPTAHEAGEIALRGTVILRVHGLRARPAAASLKPSSQAPLGNHHALAGEPTRATRPLGRRAGREILHRIASGTGPLLPALSVALGLSVAAVALEAVLFRSLLDLHGSLASASVRLGVMLALLWFTASLIAVELPLTRSWLRLGRRLEIGLRLAFYRKLPRLGDRYFRSRPASDSAERSHSIHGIRQLPDVLARAARALMELIVVTSAIAWLDRPSALPAAILAMVAVALPIVLAPTLIERDLSVRSQQGAMMQFFLDALLGDVPIKNHAAERNMLSEHEKSLSAWVQGSRALGRLSIGAQALQSLCTSALVVWLVASYALRVSDPASVLLLVYWALELPAIGGDFAAAINQYPSLRNRAQRLLEPLGAAEPGPPRSADDAPATATSGGVSLAFEHVSISAGGHTLLDDITLEIAAGSHVAIVGASGAGKTSLVSALLGWHRPAHGKISADGVELAGACASALRRATAWVDPTVTLWNRSAYDNLRYGASEDHPAFASVVDAADLGQLLATLPGGLQTPLGESGGLLAGGEGQRIRLGRALLRKSASLVILDEPFRGLDRDQRHALLTRARKWWSSATLLFVTHDIGEACGFDRVLLMEGGRVLEDGAPETLAASAHTAFARLLRAEAEVLDEIWKHESWRKLTLRDGKLVSPEAAE